MSTFLGFFVNQSKSKKLTNLEITCKEERLPFVRNFGENFRQMVLVFFLAPETGTGLSCTIYKIPVNFSLSLVMKPGTSNPEKWYRKFRSFR